MRYRAEHKDEIHQKIVKDASRRVRAGGLAGASVSTLMKDAGLTHGGFYKHFESKDDLLMESVDEAFTEMAEYLVRIAKQSKPETAWKAIVKTYLSAEHCDHAERGCPLAALGPELARTAKTTKAPLHKELSKYRDRILPFMPGRRAPDKERAFFLIFSTMIGAVEIARILPEPTMREKVLANAREFLLHSF